MQKREKSLREVEYERDSRSIRRLFAENKRLKELLKSAADSLERDGDLPKIAAYYREQAENDYEMTING